MIMAEGGDLSLAARYDAEHAGWYRAHWTAIAEVQLHLSQLTARVFEEAPGFPVGRVLLLGPRTMQRNLIAGRLPRSQCGGRCC